MVATLKFLVLAAGLLALGLTEITAKKWWETASIYQIYPRSFKDSDGDGVGDIKGITQQLDYLKEIGVDMVWLSPIFTSPMADFGYDISNFTEIDPIFGTMEDFEELLVKTEAVGINVILDFVPNHSSDECEWFRKSAAGDAEYKDFYVWHPGHMENGLRKPPNNWISVFRQSMWTWNEQRQAYYLHQFHSKQPDFNYRNPKVRERMNEVLRFWLRKGVAGFRMDAVAHLYEIAPDASGNWPDEPRNPWVDDPEDYMSLEHIYTINQQETFDLLFDFRELLDEMSITLGGGERIIMSEAYSPIELIMKYYGNETTKGVQMPFNFEFISHLSNDSNAHQYAQLINGWLLNMPKGRTANWVLGNHDSSRVGSRMGKDRIDMFNILLFTLPGVSVTYMGEEIGMTNVWISWDDTVDPQACQSNTNNYERLTRDPSRTPFQWNGENFAGFTKGENTWLPIANDYKLVNVEYQRSIERSHLNIFKQLQELKKTEPVMQSGSVEVKAFNPNVLAIKRSLKGKRSYIVLLNIMDDVESINVHAAFTGISKTLEYIVVTAESVRRQSDKVYAESVLLLPKEAVILRTTS